MNYRSILPFKRISLFTNKSPKAITLLLDRVIRNNEYLFNRGENDLVEYYGNVDQDRFLITSNPNFGNRWYPIFITHNFFTPIFSGKITFEGEDTKVTVTAFFPTHVYVISTIFYCLFLMPVCFVVYYSFFSGSGIRWTGIFISFFFIGGLYFWQMRSLNNELRRVIVFLNKTIAACHAE